MLTDSEKKVLDCIRGFHMRDGRPSVREICEKTGISSSSAVWTCVESLRQKGFIETDENRARSIRLKNADGTVFARVPVISGLDVITGRTVPEIPEEFVPFDLPPRIAQNAFAVKMKNDLLQLKENDVAVFAKTGDAEHGKPTCFSLAGELIAGVCEMSGSGACAVIGSKRIPLGADADIAVAGRLVGFIRKCF